MEQHLVDLVRKPWVILVKLASEKSCNVVAKHWLNKRGATWKEFMQASGIDLRLYRNHYVETGGDDAPTSPILPSTIFPVLIIQKNGKEYRPLVVSVPGFMHNTTEVAWVKTAQWEEMLGDQDYLEKNFPKVEKQSDKGWQQAQAYAQKLMTTNDPTRGKQ